jgi:hypothetical protein
MVGPLDLRRRRLVPPSHVVGSPESAGALAGPRALATMTCGGPAGPRRPCTASDVGGVPICPWSAGAGGSGGPAYSAKGHAPRARRAIPRPDRPRCKTAGTRGYSDPARVFCSAGHLGWPGAPNAPPVLARLRVSGLTRF